MRILQISDFHLDAKTKEDSIKHIVNPLINTLKEIQTKKPIDLIIFTGDFINIGGKNYTSLTEALFDSEETLIKPLLKVTNLKNDRFFFVPGNHDIDRKADSIRMELGLQQDLDSQAKINDFILSPEGNKRIKEFKEFEEYFYDGLECCVSRTDFHSTYKIRIDDLNIGIACLNSSWRCYDSDKDKGLILIGGKQITDSLNDIEECDLKIALSHHHYEWLKEFDKDDVEILLKQDFNMFFTGHTHKTKVGYTQDPDGKMFSFCSSGTLSQNIINPERKYENGFSVIDYDYKQGRLLSTFYKSEYPKKYFILNSSIGNNGVWDTKIPIGEEVEKIVFEQDLVKQINKEALPHINKNLLT